MSRIFIALTALSMSAAVPAIAQDAQPMPAPNDPTMQQPASEPVPAPEAAPAPAPAPSKADRVKEVVDAEFPAYDADKDGDLNKAEFTKWVTALREKGGASTTDAEGKKWLTDAFVVADADKSKKISKVEMNNFLMG